jgi:hypothetical protein
MIREKLVNLHSITKEQGSIILGGILPSILGRHLAIHDILHMSIFNGIHRQLVAENLLGMVRHILITLSLGRMLVNLNIQLVQVFSVPPMVGPLGLIGLLGAHGDSPLIRMILQMTTLT